jgi:hypothetical protein
MKEVFTDQDHARVSLYKSLLDDAGIPNLIRNESADHSGAGIHCPQFFPSLCVLNDEDYDEALRILRTLRDAPEVPQPDWKCAACQEDNPGTFDSCWKCGTPHGT